VSVCVSGVYAGFVSDVCVGCVQGVYGDVSGGSFRSCHLCHVPSSRTASLGRVCISTGRALEKDSRTT